MTLKGRTGAGLDQQIPVVRQPKLMDVLASTRHIEGAVTSWRRQFVIIIFGRLLRTAMVRFDSAHYINCGGTESCYLPVKSMANRLQAKCATLGTQYPK